MTHLEKVFKWSFDRGSRHMIYYVMTCHISYNKMIFHQFNENQTLCFFSLTLLEKANSHWLHLKGLSIVWWCLMWSNNSVFLLTLWSQKSHLNGFSICLFNLWQSRSFSVYVTKSHLSQRCSSHLCFCMWLLRLVFVKHLCSQISQIYLGSPWCFFTWFKKLGSPNTDWKSLLVCIYIYIPTTPGVVRSTLRN